MLAGSLLFAAAVVAAPLPKDAPSKGDSLEGKWQLVSFEEKGGPAEKPDEPETLIVKGGEMVFQRGEQIERRPFTVDSTQTPAQIDLKFGPGRVCHAIFRIDKDELVMCAGSNFNYDEPEDRPKEFITGPPEQRPQKGKLLFRFKRVKE